MVWLTKRVVIGGPRVDLVTVELGPHANAQPGTTRHQFVYVHPPASLPAQEYKQRCFGMCYTLLLVKSQHEWKICVCC